MERKTNIESIAKQIERLKNHNNSQRTYLQNALKQIEDSAIDAVKAGMRSVREVTRDLENIDRLRDQISSICVGGACSIERTGSNERR